MFTFARVLMLSWSFKPRTVAEWAVTTYPHYYSYKGGGQRGEGSSGSPLNQSNHWQ